MLKKLWLLLLGDVVSALAHERELALSVFQKAKDDLNNVVAKINAEVKSVEDKANELLVKRQQLIDEGAKAQQTLTKISSLV